MPITLTATLTDATTRKKYFPPLSLSHTQNLFLFLFLLIFLHTYTTHTFPIHQIQISKHT